MEDAIDVGVAELLNDDEPKLPRRRAAPPPPLERERDQVASRGATAAASDGEEAWVQDMRRDLDAWGVDSGGSGASERRGGAAAAAAAAGGVGGSRVEYVAARLAKLAEGVHTRLETLQAEDDDLSARYDKVSKYRRQLQSQTPNAPVAAAAARGGDGGSDASDGEAPPQPLQNYQLTARETDLARLAAVSSQLRKRRTALWEALDTAQERADELARARRALRDEGLRGLRELVVRRRVSRNLATYLERLLGPLY